MRPWTRVTMLACIGADLVLAGWNIAAGSFWGVVINLVAALVVALIWWRGERRIRWYREQTRQILELMAPRPEGVAVIRADGTRTPCELIYKGVEDGQHIWEVAGVVVRHGDTMYADMMPGHTGIEFEREP